MDIRKWLEETMQPEAPHEPIQHARKTQKLESVKCKRLRKRSKSDSSLLDPHSGHPQKSSPNERKAPTDGGTEESASEARQATSSDSIQSNRYARRPRRKTRPDHYENPSNVVTGERGKPAHRRGKGESKKPRRKSRRKKGEQGEKPSSGVVQSFHAKNVSSDRLTLKPRELGLFNKGRASAAVKGRGLPDLVFSEMKFLQKHKDQPEDVPQLQPSVPKKKRKKEYIQTKQGEISAYFTSARPPLAEKDGNTLPCHDKLRETYRRDREKSPTVDAAIPTIEVASKASYLGFGSRGLHHESTSYVSWSDSARTPSTAPARPHVAAADRKDYQLGSDLHGLYERRTDGSETAFKRPAPPSVTKRKTDGTSEQFRVSSLISSHNRVSRSQSYPQAPSFPQRVNLVDQSAKTHGTDSASSPSSMPPSMPARANGDDHHIQPARALGGIRAGTTPLLGTNALPEQRQHDPNSEYDEMNPHTSSDLEKVLEQCNTTFYERRQEAAPRRRHADRIRPPTPAYRQRRHADESSYPQTQRMSTVRFADTVYQGTSLANFAGPSIYEQQVQRRQHPLQPDIEGDFQQDSYYPIEHGYLGLNEMTYTEQDWGCLPEERLSYGFEGEGEVYGSGGAYVAEEEEVVQDLRPENKVVAPGFWRPNRLY